MGRLDHRRFANSSAGLPQVHHARAGPTRRTRPELIGASPGAMRLIGLDPEATRRQAVDRVNPRYVLRNHLAQQAIDAAEGGDFVELHTLA